MLLTLSACGFEPMYAAGNAAAKTLSTATPGIEVASIPDREGQHLRNLLIDRLYANGRPADAPYLLQISPLETEIVNMGIQRNAAATRAQMRIIAHLQLIDKSTGKVLLQRTVKADGAYNLLDNQLATLVSQQNVTENVLREISDTAVTELALYFRRQEQAGL